MKNTIIFFGALLIFIGVVVVVVSLIDSADYDELIIAERSESYYDEFEKKCEKSWDQR